LGEVIKSLNLSINDLMTSDVVGELDPDLTDLELLEEWNHMYDNYGYLMSDFKEKWEKERLKGEPLFKPNSKFEYHSEIEELKQRIYQLELEVKRLKMKGSKRIEGMG
jgi:predicted nuclease with TOPRIM domain